MLRLLRFATILVFVLSSAACRETGGSTPSRRSAKPQVSTTNNKDLKKKKKEKTDEEESSGTVKDDTAEDSRDEIKDPPASAMLPASTLSVHGEKIEGTSTLNLAPME